MKDNFHDKIEGGSKTANKYLVYGKGTAKEMFLNKGLNYDKITFTSMPITLTLLKRK